MTLLIKSVCVGPGIPGKAYTLRRPGRRLEKKYAILVREWLPAGFEDVEKISLG
jgi:hypothetical protein